MARDELMVGDPERLRDLLGYRLRRIQVHFARRFAVETSRIDIRNGGFTALALIEARPGLSQTSLGAALGFDKASVVAIIDNLEGQGWARRETTAEDRRRRSLFITEAGRAQLADLAAIAAACEAPAMASLTEAESRHLIRLLDKVYAACVEDSLEDAID